LQTLLLPPLNLAAITQSVLHRSYPMKKIIVLITLVVLVVACSRKAVPVTEAIAKEKGLAPSGAVDASRASLGRLVYTNRCGRCHGLKPVQKYSAQEWEPLLTVMIRKARLDAEDSANVTAYVFSNAKKATPSY
jgi:hypothetical protein